MAKEKRSFSPQFKANVVIEALREQDTVAAIAAKHDVSPNLVFKWRKEFLENAAGVFGEQARERAERRKEEEVARERDEMLRKIGQLTLERDYLQGFCDRGGLRPR